MDMGVLNRYSSDKCLSNMHAVWVFTTCEHTHIHLRQENSSPIPHINRKDIAPWFDGNSPAVSPEPLVKWVEEGQDCFCWFFGQPFGLAQASLLDIAPLDYCCLCICLSLLSPAPHHIPPLTLTWTPQLASILCLSKWVHQYLTVVTFPIYISSVWT